MNRYMMFAGFLLSVGFCGGGTASAAGPAAGHPSHGSHASIPSPAVRDTSLFSRPDTSLFPIIDFVPDTTSITDTSVVFALETGSRLYPDWKEPHSVRLGERFPIGDTEFSGIVTRFLPDFRLVDGRAVSASHRLDNPAVRVVTWRDSTAVDSSWAFLNFPPHFSPLAFFTFQLKAITGYAALRDSAQVKTE